MWKNKWINTLIGIGIVITLVGVYVVIQMLSAGYFGPVLQGRSVKVNLTPDAIASGKVYTSDDFYKEISCTDDEGWSVEVVNLGDGSLRLNCKCRFANSNEAPHIFFPYTINQLEKRDDVQSAEKIYERVPLGPVIVFYIVAAFVAVALFPVSLLFYWLVWKFLLLPKQSKIQ